MVAEEEAGAGGFPAARVSHLRGGREGRRGERVSEQVSSRCPCIPPEGREGGREGG